jgi:hypothetical protein
MKIDWGFLGEGGQGAWRGFVFCVERRCGGVSMDLCV